MSDELIKTAKRLGAVEEQNRILNAIENADLPLGMWPLIRDIIIPKYK